MADKPPFDPIWGAWVLLLAIVAALFVNSCFIFVGCSVLRVPEACAFRGVQLTQLGTELIAAIAVLIAARKN